MTTEGATRIHTGFLENAGPQKKSPEGAFFNPAMAANRDLSVRLVADYAARRGRSIDVADVLAGTGARSLRIANESPGDVCVHANDADPRAVAAIRQGIESNGLDNVEVHHGGAHPFLAGQRFDVVDVDPFGSPMPFLDAAMRATRHDGLLCITATDTAALSGTYPRVCQRRYGARHDLRQAPWKAEAGLRILAGAIIRAAGRFDRAAVPVMSVSGGHWMRVVCRITDGRQAADDVWRKLGTVGVDAAGMACEGTTGPLWKGPLHESGFMQRMVESSVPISAASERLLARLAAEGDAPPFWIDPGSLRRVLGTDMPKRDALMERLRGAGFVATTTHIDPQGIRTDADLDAIRRVWD